MLKTINIMAFSLLSICIVFLQDQEPDRPRPLLTIQPGYDGDQDELTDEEIWQTIRKEDLVARTMKFLSEGLDMESFQHLATTHNQRKEFTETLEEFRELKEKLESLDDDELAKLLKIKTVHDSSRDRMVLRYRRSLEKGFTEKMVESLVTSQVEEIVNWHPDNQNGLVKTLTETPVGDALGLSKSQKDKLRKRSNEIANNLFEEYVKARIDAEEMFAEVLDEEKVDRLRRLYSPSSTRRFGILTNELNIMNIIRKLTYEYPEDVIKELAENRKFDDQEIYEQEKIFGVRNHVNLNDYRDDD